MPDAPSVHDIATPRHQIGGRCRKWCISTQPTSDKRKCGLPVVCVGYNSVTEKRVSNSGAIVKPTTTTSMHTVLTEVLVMTVSCTQSNPWIRKQLKLSPANVKLSSGQLQTQRSCCPWHRTRIKPPQLPLTPDDEQDLFGREEALRMDEEIMDFQWFQCVSWNSVKDLRGTPHVQPPRRFKFALQQAQHAILRAIMHNNPPLWPPSQLGNLLCSAAGSSWDGVLSARRKATVLTTWMPDSSGLKTVQPWAMVRAECDVALVHSATRRTTTEQKHAHIRKVATLARSGEKGRALAAASNAPPVSVTEHIVQEIKSLYPTGPEPPAPVQALHERVTRARAATQYTPAR